jgi:hypothetical protein
MTIPVMSSRFFMCPSSADGAPPSVRPAPVSRRACMWIDRTHRYVRLMRTRPSHIRAASAMQGANSEAIREGGPEFQEVARNQPTSGSVPTPQRLLAISTEMQRRTRLRRAGRTIPRRSIRPVRNHARPRAESSRSEQCVDEPGDSKRNPSLALHDDTTPSTRSARSTARARATRDETSILRKMLRR